MITTCDRLPEKPATHCNYRPKCKYTLHTKQRKHRKTRRSRNFWSNYHNSEWNIKTRAKVIWQKATSLGS